MLISLSATCQPLSNAFHALPYFILLTSILQTRKMKHREVLSPAQHHTGPGTAHRPPAPDSMLGCPQSQGARDLRAGPRASLPTLQTPGEVRALCPHCIKKVVTLPYNKVCWWSRGPQVAGTGPRPRSVGLLFVLPPRLAGSTEARNERGENPCQALAQIRVMHPLSCFSRGKKRRAAASGRRKWRRGAGAL